MKIKFGAIVTDGRGKLGGHVFSKNRAGAYARTKVTPVNPSTPEQSIARNRLTSLSQAWRSLTEDQRQQWNDAVLDFQKTDIFGDTVTPSGKNLFVSLNANLDLVGVARILVPPVPGDIPAMSSIDATYAAGLQTASLAFAPSPVPVDTAFLVFATSGISPGINFVSTRLRLIGVLDAAATTPDDISDLYTAKYGAVPAAGLKVFTAVRGINKITGQAGALLKVSDLVAA